MFDKLDIGMRERLHVLEVDTDGRWVSNRSWAILYPDHVLTVDEMMAKTGIYYSYKEGQYSWGGQSEVTMKGLFPHASHKGTELARRLMYNHPLTVDYDRSRYSRSAVVKCYIMEPAHSQVDNIDAPLLIHKRYYDKIRRLYPDVKAFGTTLDRPVFFGKYAGLNDTWHWVAALMPVNHLGSTGNDDLVGYLARLKEEADRAKAPKKEPRRNA